MRHEININISDRNIHQISGNDIYPQKSLKLAIYQNNFNFFLSYLSRTRPKIRIERIQQVPSANRC